MKVNPAYIILGREARGYTQKEFTDLLKIEQGTLSKLENGVLPTSVTLLEKISSTLKFPPEFFLQTKNTDRVKGHYRKKVSIPQRELKQQSALMTIAETAILKLLESVEIPAPQIPKWDVTSDGSPAEAAKYARNFWKITKGRIVSLSKVFENNGILIIPLDLGSLDGLSTYFETHIPVLFLNRQRPGDRQRFTLAHELGHLVMHFGQKISEDRDIEEEANKFASEFLLPESEIKPMLPARLSLERLSELKSYWFVSMQAILRRAFDLNKITYDQYGYTMRKMSAMGLRTNEKTFVPQEQPSLLKEMLDAHVEELNYSLQELSKVFAIMEDEVRSMFFEQRAKLKVIGRSID